MSSSADTPIFSSSDGLFRRLLEKPLSLLDPNRLATVRGILLITSASIFAMGLIRNTAISVVSLIAIIFTAAGCLVSALRGNALSRSFLDGLRTARAGMGGLAALNVIVAASVVVFGPWLGLDASHHLAKSACYVILSLTLYTLPLETAGQRPLRAEAVPTDSPRVEYDRLNDELVGLKRREREIDDRKAELEKHPDINRA